MPIRRLEIRNVRLFQHAQIEFDQDLTLISGSNASGKTSLLEAVHILATGRSFRTVTLDQVQRHGSNGLVISAFCQNQSLNSENQVTFFWKPEQRKLSLNGNSATSHSEIANLVPVVNISSNTHFDFKNSVRSRRGIIDWILFHVEPDFYNLWKKYQRILLQRNAVLKEKKQHQTSYIWDEELSELGETIHAQRSRFIGELNPIFRTIYSKILPNSVNCRIEIQPGWNTSERLLDCLKRSREKDRNRGFTQSGPHRDDLKILIDDLDSAEFASNGQYKMLIVALRLTQATYLTQASGRKCTLLLDDLSAELDKEHKIRIYELLTEIPAQIVATTTSETEIFNLPAWQKYSKFHVKHGSIFKHH